MACEMAELKAAMMVGDWDGLKAKWWVEELAIK